MYEEAQNIFKYLPIEPGDENLYIQHLWGAFEAVNEKDEPIRAFSILPFHLLFMLAVQYKVYRISAHFQEEYLTKLNTCNLYDTGHKQVLANNPPLPDSSGNVPSSCSVRNLSFIPEGRLFDFLRIAGVEDGIISKSKELVEIRSTYAHANGNIEENIDARIDDYLELLQAIQPHIHSVNNAVQQWSSELVPGEYPLDDFFQERFLFSQFSPLDFGDTIPELLETEDIHFEQWEQIINKGLELAYDQTILTLHDIAENDPDESKQFNATRILDENGEKE